MLENSSKPYTNMNIKYRTLTIFNCGIRSQNSWIIRCDKIEPFGLAEGEEKTWANVFASTKNKISKGRYENNIQNDFLSTIYSNSFRLLCMNGRSPDSWSFYRYSQRINRIYDLKMDKCDAFRIPKNHEEYPTKR